MPARPGAELLGRVLQVVEPQSGTRLVLCVVQLLQGEQLNQNDTRNGKRINGSYLAIACWNY